MGGSLKDYQISNMPGYLGGDPDTGKYHKKIPWAYAPAFLLFWLVLFVAVVLPVFFSLPTGLTIKEELEHPGEFIAERAEQQLFAFDQIGVKVVGSYNNENVTVKWLQDEIEKIRQVMHADLFEMDIRRQQQSGAYMHRTMINMYQGLQNVIVKLSSRNSSSENYLLVNSHFDTKPGSPGTGDDGAMVVVMLEILRVMATTRETFTHPVVFLFNGAEENPLQASHAFIAHHEWAPKCKALINLDSAGSGHREILMQSGPNHPWLMKYFQKSAKHPYATTMAEELFQADIIPSDTDFRIFRDFGSVPGLDFDHSYNGYVYHTKFDRFDVIPRGTLQNTGDNILAMTRALSNAPEMEDTEKYAEGHTVFYDFLHQFVIYYTETTGQITNTCVSVITMILVVVSMWQMVRKSYISGGSLAKMFGIILVLQFLGVVLALGLPVLMAVLYDADDNSMTWFTHKWLVLGVYVCPSLFGLGAPPLIFLSMNRNDKISKSYKLQLVLHAHSVIMSVLCIVFTFVGIRSSYTFMLVVFFYGCSLLLNLLTFMHDKGYLWTVLLVIGQIMPFLYFSYITHSFLCTLMPMMGRFGSGVNPDLYVSGICAIGTIWAMGFVIPLVSLFKRPKLVLSSLLVVMFVFCMITLSDVGFPYRPKTNVERVNFLHVRRTFYEYNQTISLDESGYYFDFQDRRTYRPVESVVPADKLISVADDCDEMMMCGMPLFNYRWQKSQKRGYWLPTDTEIEVPYRPTLTLISRSLNADSQSMRFEFELDGPPHMSIFVQTMDGADLVDWSFLRQMLDDPDKYPHPLHIYYSYGNDKTPMRFHFDIKAQNGRYDEPLFELGISGHFLSYDHARDKQGQEFISSFPDYVFVMEWPSSYQRYIY